MGECIVCRSPVAAMRCDAMGLVGIVVGETPHKHTKQTTQTTTPGTTEAEEVGGERKHTLRGSIRTGRFDSTSESIQSGFTSQNGSFSARAN